MFHEYLNERIRAFWMWLLERQERVVEKAMERMDAENQTDREFIRALDEADMQQRRWNEMIHFHEAVLMENDACKVCVVC